MLLATFPCQRNEGSAGTGVPKPTFYKAPDHKLLHFEASQSSDTMEASGVEELVVYAEESTSNINNRKIGMALAHVSAQAHDIAEYQVQLHANQQLQAHQQQLYTESQVRKARAEAESRTQALADMICATRIDSAALEQHVNSKLQSAISVANDVAQSQARVVAEAHAAHQAQASDLRMTEALKRFESQLHATVEERMREVLTAHMEQVGAKIRLEIAQQGQEIMAHVQRQLEAFKRDIIAQVGHATSSAERKAKSIVRRHHAEENNAHEEIKTSLLKLIEESKLSAVAIATHRTEELINTWNSQLAGPVTTYNPTNQDTMILIVPFIGDGDEKSTSSDEEMKPQTKAGVVEKEADQGVLDLMRMLRAARATSEPNHRQPLKNATLSEQNKVASRALARSVAVRSSQTKHSQAQPETKMQKKLKPKSSMSTHEQIQAAVKIRSDERKALKKKRAEDAMKLAELLLDSTKRPA